VIPISPIDVEKVPYFYHLVVPKKSATEIDKLFLEAWDQVKEVSLEAIRLDFGQVDKDHIRQMFLIRHTKPSPPLRFISSSDAAQDLNSLVHAVVKEGSLFGSKEMVDDLFEASWKEIRDVHDLNVDRFLESCGLLLHYFLASTIPDFQERVAQRRAQEWSEVLSEQLIVNTDDQLETVSNKPRL